MVLLIQMYFLFKLYFQHHNVGEKRMSKYLVCTSTLILKLRELRLSNPDDHVLQSMLSFNERRQRVTLSISQIDLWPRDIESHIFKLDF